MIDHIIIILETGSRNREIEGIGGADMYHPHQNS